MAASSSSMAMEEAKEGVFVSSSHPLSTDDIAMGASLLLFVQDNLIPDDQLAVQAKAAAEAEADEEADEEEKEEEEVPPPPADIQSWTRIITHTSPPLPSLRSSEKISFPQLPSSPTPFSLFSLFFTPQIANQIVKSTNEFAPHDWTPLTVSELFAFFSVQLYMSIVPLPTLHSYWSELYRVPFVADRFSRNRFLEIQSYLRITDVEVLPEHAHNPIPVLAPLAAKFNQLFAQHCKPGRSLTLDETMVAYKGGSSIKQYIPLKPHPWGFKIFCLASQGYL